MARSPGRRYSRGPCTRFTTQYSTNRPSLRKRIWAAGELIQLYVIEQAAGLEAHEESFLEQPALPTVGSIRLPSVASDPRGHLLHTLRCLRCFLCYGLSPSLII